MAKKMTIARKHKIWDEMEKIDDALTALEYGDDKTLTEEQVRKKEKALHLKRKKLSTELRA